MRCFVLIVSCLLIGCGSKAEQKPAPPSGSAAQALVDRIASGHEGLERLTLHAVPTGKSGCTQVASTAAERRGKASDPEDLKALDTGEETVLDEDGAIDVTVPILLVDGKPTAVAGVTLAIAEGDDRDAMVEEARAVARELEAAIKAADKPLW
jgi:hypothetical protein